jgi:hypothetical protein
MILHAASIAAFFVDQLAQVPVQIQCVSNAGQDPIWVRLLFDAVPSIFALGIAALVFYWNGGREHRRWVLDQKRAEWKEVLNAVNASHTDLLRASVPEEQVDESNRKEYVLAQENILAVDRVFGDRLFIDSAIMESLKAQWHAVWEAVKAANNMENPEAAASLWYVSFRKYVEEIRTTARKDLGIDLS